MTRATRPARPTRARRRPVRAWVAMLAILALALAACAEAETGAEEEAEDPAEAADDGSDSDAADESELAAACPDPLVFQDSWWPGPDQGGLYNLIGPDGEIDAATLSYSGEIGDTGVTGEVRAGGPAIGQQSVPSLLYQSDEILLGSMHTDQQMLLDNTPTVAVFNVMNVSPQILMYDPATYDFDSVADVRDAGATVLVREGSAFVDWLVAEGLLDAEQVDASWDGSPSRFVAEGGELVQQGYVTNEPYEYNEKIEAWPGEVDYLMLHEEGYDIYQQSLTARPDVIEEEADCLEVLVPMLQQSTIDYFADPEPMLETFVEMAGVLDESWTLEPDHARYNHDALVDNDVVSNGHNDTLGDFDTDRVQRLIDEFAPTLEEAGYEPREGLEVDDLVTNEFIDPELGL